MKTTHQRLGILITSAILFFSIQLLAESKNSAAETPHRIDAAQFDSANRLVRPANIDEWIFLGATVGHGYPEEGGKKFSAENPGAIQVIQMEPAAYGYLKEHKKYADGTMISLSFYNTQEQPSPAVEGVVQKDLMNFEIHIIDKKMYKDTRAFFLYETGSDVANMIPEGNVCVTCHNKEAHFDGTFTQFYPVIRDEILGRKE